MSTLRLIIAPPTEMFFNFLSELIISVMPNKIFGSALYIFSNPAPVSVQCSRCGTSLSLAKEMPSSTKVERTEET